METNTGFNEGEEHKHLCKIVLVGDAGVGKTMILSRYVKGSLPKSVLPTIGVEFATKTVTLKDGDKVKAQIWDTAGQERYRSITSAHYRRAVGALLVYDITKEKTFSNVKKWMDDLKYQAEPEIVIILVGNKIDLCEKNPQLRKVQREEASNFAYENKLLFEETSAITAQNISEVFEKLLQEVCTQKIKNGQPSNKRNVIIGETKGEKDEESKKTCKMC